MTASHFIAKLGIAMLMVATTLTHAASGKKPAEQQFASMIDFNTADPVAGFGSLLRSKNHLKARLAMADLDPNTSYTVWWVVWNQPQLCANAIPNVSSCGLGDLTINGNAVLYAAGFVTGDDGTANLDLSLNAGRLPDGIDAPVPGKLKRGNGFKAEVHLVIRTHGAINTDIIAEQLSLFAGGCANELGQDNGLCADQRLVAFQPVR